MRTSGPSRRSSSPPAAGFTLFELLVVLAIGALLSSLVAPALIGQWEQRRESTERMALEIELSALAARVQALGRDYRFDQKALAAPLGERAAPIDVPEGWTLTVEQPVEFGMLGVCDGGTVRAASALGTRYAWRLQAPTCVPRRLDAG
jgi:prepilin-type N-terminal cleavage/methylation domain-containing protein